MDMEVKAWREQVLIPTYEIGEPEKNPIFLEKRVYQGSSGAVYPHPVIEKISDEKVDKSWNAIYLENKYLKIMILPELGGRGQPPGPAHGGARRHPGPQPQASYNFV